MILPTIKFMPFYLKRSNCFLKKLLWLEIKNLGVYCRCLNLLSQMACSRFEYVKTYEKDDTILPNVWIVIRIDGKSFHKFSKIHDFEKPNDANALNLMNHAAQRVMEEFRDCIISYGQSDEYSFIFHKETNIFNRRAAKLLSYVVSLFTSSYVGNWSYWMNKVGSLKCLPYFDGRIILYPSDKNLRDYLSWRQADVHINNLYNTAFWNLVLKGGRTNQEAEAELRGTLSAEKNELLFSQFNINYNNLPIMFRKGTILLRKRCSLIMSNNKSNNIKQMIVPFHEDMIGDSFWKTHSELLGKYNPGEHTINIKSNEFSISNDSSELLLKMQCQKQFHLEEHFTDKCIIENDNKL